MPTGKALIRKVRVIAPAALIAFSVACSTIHVSTDYNHRTDFAGYHTYSWLRVRAGNQLWEDRIRHDVDAQLAVRGWHVVPSGGQAAVAAVGITKEQPSLVTFYSGFGPDFGGWYWGGWGPGFDSGIATTQVVYTPIGSLVVDIFRTSDHHLLWRGNSEQVLSGNPRKNERKLERAIAKMFEGFPPQAKG